MRALGKMARLAAAGAVLWIAGCRSPAGDSGTHPADHTVDKSGVHHKPGLENPLTNCVACHGADLNGGTAGLSCFKCHGRKW